jgi:N-methylhydantoinase B
MMTDTEQVQHAAVDIADWNGRELPYRPGAQLRISRELKLHRASGLELDPVTFEVLSTKLWNINEEHADTIKRVSGSPVVVHANDFNTCIMTEVGDAFLFAPYIQYFAGASEFIIKYTLENRSESPGIHPGDIFVHNDPFIAGSHQQDIGVYAPVFVGDELFCWVFSACHVRDCGGVEPGSFCAQAPNIYYDPPVVRALKLADADGIRRDTEDTILRMSRLPDLLALELRSQIAGAVRARARIGELVERYGADAVKSAMHKLIDDTESAVRARLSRLPDGRWTDVVWVSGALPGDRAVHKQVLNLEKRGDSLRFDNYGTDPQFGCINCGYGQFRSAIGCALAQMLAFDHRYCVGGISRVVDCEANVGTISAVDRDGAVSALHAQLLTIYMATKVLSKMLYPDPELRRVVNAAGGLVTCAWLTQSGIDQSGNPFATVTLDEAAGGLGAFSFRDGVDQGGTTFWPKLEVADCESWEQYYPVLYLYRRGAHNGGHGKYRGGHGLTLGWVGHGTSNQLVSAISISSALPVQSGLSGGHWGQTGSFYAAHGTPIREHFSRNTLPGSPEELRALGGDGRNLPAKTLAIPLGEHDVVEMSVFGGGGYGDPLERDPEAALRDLQQGIITPRATSEIYGVVVDERGTVDAKSTTALRGRKRAERLARASEPRENITHGEAGDLQRVLDLAEHLALTRDAKGEFHIVCGACGTWLGPAAENYKQHCAVLDGSLVDIEPEVFTDPATEVDADVVYRTFLCPGCGRALDNELTLRDEAPVWDIRVDTASLWDGTEYRKRATGQGGIE